MRPGNIDSVKWQYVPRVCRITLVDASPPRHTAVRSVCFEFAAQCHPPSMTTFILFKRPWTIAKVCATVMRASSCVSRSSLFSIVSISLSPNNFFANCSATRSEVVAYDYRRPCLLSRPLPICFFATASIEINSTMIFATISIIRGSREISE
jgi:hypothetical protein